MNRMFFSTSALWIFTLMLVLAPGLSAQPRIKDVVRVESPRVALVGYGLIVGLNGSGDRSSGNRGSVFTIQSISNMLERFGITVPQEQLRTRNAAAVMVTGEIPAYGRNGTRFDITVSSLGDAKSLEGGVLLMTPLVDAAGTPFAMGQGAVSIGGFNIETSAGEQLRKNYALVGRVPDGASLTREVPGGSIDITQPLRLHLLNPDFRTASMISDSINAMISRNPAFVDTTQAAPAAPISPAMVEVPYPPSVASEGDAVRFIAALEILAVQPDVEARVVINERTGTVVAGSAVRIDEVLISHGNLTIHTRRTPVISQPAPFSTGQTVQDEVTETQAEEDLPKTAVINRTTNVGELAEALNALGLKPRDMISIFQAIKEAGALRAELIIL